jgi:hypothetical protein
MRESNPRYVQRSTEIEFDDGSWEVEVRKDGKKLKLDIDPKTGKSRAG